MSSTEQQAMSSFVWPIRLVIGGLLGVDPEDFHTKFQLWKNSGGIEHIHAICSLKYFPDDSVATGPSGSDTTGEHGKAAPETVPVATVSSDAAVTADVTADAVAADVTADAVTADFTADAVASDVTANAIAADAVAADLAEKTIVVHSLEELVKKLYEIAQHHVNNLVSSPLRIRFLGRGTNQHMDLWRVVQCNDGECVENETEFFLPHSAATLSAAEKHLIYKTARNWNGTDALTTSIVATTLRTLFHKDPDVVEMKSSLQRPTLQLVKLGPDNTLVFSDDMFMMSPSENLVCVRVDGVVFDPIFGLEQITQTEKYAHKRPMDAEEIIFGFLTAAALGEKSSSAASAQVQSNFAQTAIIAAIGESFLEAKKIALVEK